MIKNIEKNRPHGHAPDVSLFSANSSDLDAIRWAARDQGCTYEITICRCSGSDDVWFGIAWTQISARVDIFGSVNTSPAVG